MEKLPSIGTLFKTSWNTYVERFLFYTLLSFIPGLAAVIFFSISLITVIISLENQDVSYTTGKIAIIIFVSLIGVVIWLWGQSSLFYSIAHSTEKPRLKETLRKGWEFAGAYVWIKFISMLIVLGSFLLFIVPGIVLSIWISFGIFILMSEGDRGLAALVKSKEYVRDYWWAVFGRILLLFLIQAAINMIPIVSLLQIFIAPFYVIYVFTIYQQLKTLKGPMAPGQEQKNDKNLLIALPAIGYLAMIAGIVLLIAYH